MSLGKLADSFASLEAYDFRVNAITINPEDLPKLGEAYDPGGSGDVDTLIFGEIQGMAWGAWVATSDVIPIGKMLALPELKYLLLPEWGAPIQEAPLLGRIWEAAIKSLKPRGNRASRLRTQEDVEGMLRDLGPNPTRDQRDDWMDRKYPSK